MLHLFVFRELGHAGDFHPENTLMGQRNGSTKRTMLVILIQPTVAR